MTTTKTQVNDVTKKSKQLSKNKRSTLYLFPLLCVFGLKMFDMRNNLLIRTKSCHAQSYGIIVPQTAQCIVDDQVDKCYLSQEGALHVSEPFVSLHVAMYENNGSFP